MHVYMYIYIVDDILSDGTYVQMLVYTVHNNYSYFAYDIATGRIVTIMKFCPHSVLQAGARAQRKLILDRHIMGRCELSPDSVL